jgi:hypothetical protein
MAGKKCLIIDPTTGRPYDAHTDQLDSWDTPAGANAPRGKGLIARGDGNSDWKDPAGSAWGTRILDASVYHSVTDTGEMASVNPPATNYSWLFGFCVNTPCRVAGLGLHIRTTGVGNEDVKMALYSYHGYPDTLLSPAGAGSILALVAGTSGPLLLATAIDIDPGDYVVGYKFPNPPAGTWKYSGWDGTVNYYSNLYPMGYISSGGILYQVKGRGCNEAWANFPNSPYGPVGGEVETIITAGLGVLVLPIVSLIPIP